MRYRTWLLGTVLLTSLASADESLWYSDFSRKNDLQSNFGLLLEQDGLSVRSQMTLQGEAGRPAVDPAWRGVQHLDVDTMLHSGAPDDAGALTPHIDTDIRLRPASRYVERIRATARRTHADSRHSFELSFSPLETDLRLLGGDPFGLEADLAMRSGAGKRATSRVESSWGIGNAIDVDTALRLHGPSAADFSTRAWNARIVYRSPLPLIDRLEGRVKSTVDGTSQRQLAVRFPGVSRGSVYGEPFTLSSRATVSERFGHGESGALRFGIETRLAGFTPPLLGGRNALQLKLERRFRHGAERRTSLSYDHSWQPHDHGSVGLNLELLGAPDGTQPTVDLTWKTRF